MKMYTKFILGALISLVVSYSPMSAASDANLGVMPIQSNAFGKSYGVWGQEFAQWLFQFSGGDFPLFQPSGDTDCGISQSGKVWFLYGLLDGDVERNCTIPTGKALFISVNSVLSFVPLYGNTEEAIREDAARDLAGVDTLVFSIDGVPIDPFSYRATSPEGGFIFSIQEGSILNEFGLQAGDYDPAIVDGYYMMLRPLSVGEHTVQWSSSGSDQYGSYYSYSVTWNLTITGNE
jgi:hypothetical protein